MSDFDVLPPLSLAVIEDLKRQGLNETQIADIYGVTKQAINYWVQTYNGKLTPRQLVRKEFPYKVPSEYAQASPHRRLRDHGEFRALGYKRAMNEMTADQLNRLRSFYRKLREENLVVEFDPAIPPIPGVSTKGGWAFRGRVSGDGDLLIRENEFSFLTEDGRSIWRFPPREP